MNYKCTCHRSIAYLVFLKSKILLSNNNSSSSRVTSPIKINNVYYRSIHGKFVYMFRPIWTIIRQHITLKCISNNYCTISCLTLEILILFVKSGRSSPVSVRTPCLLSLLCDPFPYVVTFGLFSQFTTFI